MIRTIQQSGGAWGRHRNRTDGGATGPAGGGGRNKGVGTVFTKSTQRNWRLHVDVVATLCRTHCYIMGRLVVTGDASNSVVSRRRCDTSRAPISKWFLDMAGRCKLCVVHCSA